MFDPDWLNGKAPYMAHLITWMVVGWFASSAQGNLDKAMASAHRLPVVEERLADQGRRIDRLENMDSKLDKLAENMAAVMQELKTR
tara:strand:- start:138 stop:395 length:258 start_codon:yes stop_codon:yes gene_type:complete